MCSDGFSCEVHTPQLVAPCSELGHRRSVGPPKLELSSMLFTHIDTELIYVGSDLCPISLIVGIGTHMSSALVCSTINRIPTFIEPHRGLDALAAPWLN